jgi:hypothetical protein
MFEELFAYNLMLTTEMKRYGEFAHLLALLYEHVYLIKVVPKVIDIIAAWMTPAIDETTKSGVWSMLLNSE